MMRCSTGRSVAGLAAFLGVFLVGSPHARAQSSGTILGTVLDASTFEPLVGARVELMGRDWWLVADETGRFSFEGVGPGDVSVRVVHEGYGTVVERLPVTALEVALIQFQMLPIAAVLDEILVEVRGERASAQAEGRVVGDGLESMTAADLLARRVPGLSVDRTSGAVGSGARVLIRGVSSMTSNAPAIYLDGIRIDDRSSPLRGSRGPQAFHALELIPASEVRQIRVLRGAAAAAQYGESANGVILIETRRGEPGGGAPRP